MCVCVCVTLPPLEKYLNWIFDPAPPPSRDHGDLASPAPSRDHGIQTNGKENMPPKTRPASFRRSYGRVGERRGSLGQPPIRILCPGRLEVGLSVRQQPIEIRHSKRLAQRPGLGQRPIIIQHSRRLAQRPGLGQRPMIIRRSLEIGLESAGQ